LKCHVHKSPRCEWLAYLLGSKGSETQSLQDPKDDYHKQNESWRGIPLKKNLDDGNVPQDHSHNHNQTDETQNHAQ